MESLPIRYFDSNSRGDIMSIYTNDIDTMRQVISQSIPSLFQSSVTILGVVVCMIFRSIPLTIITFVMVFVMLAVTMKLSKKSGAYFIEQQKNIGKVNGYIEEMMTGQKVVKVFCHEEESIKKFDEMNDKLFDSAK
jgi:ABC-type multidrug transport system, ATPase and permease components